MSCVRFYKRDSDYNNSKQNTFISTINRKMFSPIHKTKMHHVDTILFTLFSIYLIGHLIAPGEISGTMRLLSLSLFQEAYSDKSQLVVHNIKFSAFRANLLL